MGVKGYGFEGIDEFFDIFIPDDCLEDHKEHPFAELEDMGFGEQVLLI